MPGAYPRFKAVSGESDLDLGTYIPENITGKAERDAYFRETRGERFHPHLSISKTSRDHGVSHELRAEHTLLNASDEEEANMEGFQKLLMSWADDPPVKAMTVEMVRCEKELEEALERFRSSLQEVTLQIAFG